MNKTKHTPGPWKLHEWEDGCYDVLPNNGERLHVLAILRLCYNKADAQLIADAPRLAEENAKLKEELEESKYETVQCTYCGPGGTIQKGDDELICPHCHGSEKLKVLRWEPKELSDLKQINAELVKCLKSFVDDAEALMQNAGHNTSFPIRDAKKLINATNDNTTKIA